MCQNAHDDILKFINEGAYTQQLQHLSRQKLTIQDFQNMLTVITSTCSDEWVSILSKSPTQWYEDKIENHIMKR